MNRENTRFTKTIGFAGTSLFLLGVTAMAIPRLRSLPILDFSSLIVGTMLCAIGAIKESKWFLVPGFVALCFLTVLFISVLSE